MSLNINIDNRTKKCWAYIKKETVLFTATLLALLSMFFVTPDLRYLAYIDYRTLAILFCLMTVMVGLQNLGIFKWAAQQLLQQVHTLRQLSIILILLCFFFSMVITNDVALITFVPLTFTVIGMLNIEEKKSKIIAIVVMQTIAANLGSMLTPIGNPQNLYLFSQTNMGLGAFLWLMLPYVAASLIMLCIWNTLYSWHRNSPLNVTLEACKTPDNRRLLAVYAGLFTLSLLTVIRVLPYPLLFGLVIFAVLISDRQALKQVDYSLLLTFVAFFLFIGNMGRVPVFKSFLQSMIYGHEALTAVVASQLISNVPAALLLSGFTERINALIIGTNLGGLGTLIASMASLISYKYIAQYDHQLCSGYFKYFTIANLGFLAVLMGLFVLLYH